MDAKKRHILNLMLLSIIALGTSFSLTLLNNKFFNSSNFWIPTLFFFITTLGISFLVTSGEKESKEFIFKTLAMTMARLLLCMVFVFIYSLINKADALAFTCHFMVQYVFFTIFEISYLLKYIKPQNTNS